MCSIEFQYSTLQREKEYAGAQSAFKPSDGTNHTIHIVSFQLRRTMSNIPSKKLTEFSCLGYGRKPRPCIVRKSCRTWPDCWKNVFQSLPSLRRCKRAEQLEKWELNSVGFLSGCQWPISPSEYGINSPHRDYFSALLRTHSAFVAPTQGKLLNYVERIPLGVVGQIIVGQMTTLLRMVSSCECFFLER